MNIIIVGCGQVGQNLAERLINDGNNVTIIDKSYDTHGVYPVCQSLNVIV